jgi:uncharacterized membrane protein
MRIARPILLVSTPIGVAFGLREAWRLAGPGMALLMAAMLAVVGGLVWMTVRTIRREHRASLEAAAAAATAETRPPRATEAAGDVGPTP